MPPSEDPFIRLRSNYLLLVFVEGDTKEQKLYNINRLLNRRVKRKRGKYITDYLLWQKEYRAEYDTQYNIEYLRNTRGFIIDYENKLRRIS